MATIGKITTSQPGRSFHTIWETMTENDAVGNALTNPGASDRSVHLLGTIGGATILIEGSNVLAPSVDADWFTLHDENGDLLSFTAVDDGHAISENVLHYRPRLTDGSGTDVDIIIFSRSTM